ncbi:HAD family hydrolase [Streptomyces pharetrae]|uniref:HAD family hydrolase n=1 Tax=Streptomyces pharetrae TaxID=291370 RepID=UPI003654E4F2
MGKSEAAHIVWDWNGTLFHDNDAIIGATNAAFAELGLEPITLEQYRAMYCVPVPKFYERLLGRLPSDAEWEVMDGTFQRHYAEHRVRCGLTEGAVELLTGWRSAGRSQSILSMYGHEELVPLVRGFGIESHFVRVDGRTGPSGGSKAEHMVRHLAALAEAGGAGRAGVDPARTVVIGDAADDAVAARHVGARAVLYTGGSHSRGSLEAVGAPVVDSLAEAVAVAERLAMAA